MPQASTSLLHASLSLIASTLSRNSLIERSVLSRARASWRSCGPEGLRTSEPSNKEHDLEGPGSRIRFTRVNESFGGGTSDAFRRNMTNRIAFNCVISLLALAGTVSPAWAQAETITATASVKNASGASTSAPLTVVVDRFATDAERDSLLAAVKSGGHGGRPGAPRQTAGRRNASARLAALPSSTHYARNAGSGRLITVITAQPIGGLTPNRNPVSTLSSRCLNSPLPARVAVSFHQPRRFDRPGREPSSLKAPPLPTPCSFRTSPRSRATPLTSAPSRPCRAYVGDSFGLIMVLTFTSSISVAEGGREETREILVGALACNLAWGLVDAVMFLMSRFIERARNMATLRAIGGARSPDVAHRLILAGLPPLVVSDALDSRGRIAASTVTRAG